jgi:WD40 repeat protein
MFVAYSPDSQRIVLGDASGHTTVWDAGHGTQVLDLIGEKPNASSVCFSPDGTVIITADSNGIQAVLWDVASGRQIRTFPGGFGIGSFSPDSRFLAIGMPATSGRVVNIWDLHSNTVTMTLKGHEMTVTAAKFSPDGSALITGSSDKTVRVWDVKTGTQRFALLGHSRSVYDVAFSPDGRTIATVSADGMVKLWSADGPFEPRQLEGEYGWQVGHGWTSLALSPDGHYVLAGTGSDARILDLSSGRYTKELKGHQANVKRVAWSRDGRRILTVSWDKTAKVWDSVDGRLIASLEGHKDKLADGAFSPNGQCVVTGAADKTARVWDATTGRELRQLSGHKGLVAAVAWSPDGQVIATSDQFGGVRLWGADVDTPPRSTEERGMVSLAFSADGRSLAGGDTAGKTFIWELPTLRRVLALVGHGDWVISSAFSPDGQLLATGARDGSVRLWNTVTGRSLINLPVGTAILSLEFFQDGKSLAVARATYSSQIWHALDWKTTTPESLQTYKLERYSAFLAAGKSGLGSQ